MGAEEDVRAVEVWCVQGFGWCGEDLKEDDHVDLGGARG